MGGKFLLVPNEKAVLYRVLIMHKCDGDQPNRENIPQRLRSMQNAVHSRIFARGMLDDAYQLHTERQSLLLSFMVYPHLLSSGIQSFRRDDVSWSSQNLKKCMNIYILCCLRPSTISSTVSTP